jgi:hypothetical protein
MAEHTSTPITPALVSERLSELETKVRDEAESLSAFRRAEALHLALDRDEIAELRYLRTIAAAPKLLEALKQICGLYKSDPDDLETMDKGIKIAEAAIAETEGGA